MATTDTSDSSDGALSFTQGSRPCSFDFQPLEAGALHFSLDAAIKCKEDAEQRLIEKSEEVEALKARVQELTELTTQQAATNAQLAESKDTQQEEASQMRNLNAQLKEQVQQQASAAAAMKVMLATVCKESSEASKEVERLNATMARFKAEGICAAQLEAPKVTLRDENAEQSKIAQQREQLQQANTRIQRQRMQLKELHGQMRVMKQIVQQDAQEWPVKLTTPPVSRSRLHGESVWSSRPAVDAVYSSSEGEKFTSPIHTGTSELDRWEAPPSAAPPSFSISSTPLLTQRPPSLPAGGSCTSSSMEESDLLASLHAALKSRLAAEQRMEEMSKEVTALKVSNHQLMRTFNRDWKRKAIQLQGSEAALQEEVAELRGQIAQLQEQASASAATRSCKVTRAGKNRW